MQHDMDERRHPEQQLLAHHQPDVSGVIKGRLTGLDADYPVTVSVPCCSIPSASPRRVTRAYWL